MVEESVLYSAACCQPLGSSGLVVVWMEDPLVPLDVSVHPFAAIVRLLEFLDFLWFLLYVKDIFLVVDNGNERLICIEVVWFG